MPYSAFDKLQRVSHAAIVENKRLGEILAWIKEQHTTSPALIEFRMDHDDQARSRAF